MTVEGPKSKMSQIARVLRLRELLDHRPYVTVAELREQFGVSRRTIYNDFEALQTAGVPLYNELGPNNEARWQIPASAKRRVVKAAGDGFCSLIWCGRLVVLHEPVACAPPSVESVETSSGQVADHDTCMFHRGIGARLSRQSFLSDLLICLRTDTLAKVSIKASPGRQGTHIVEPYAVVLMEKRISLLVYNRGTKAVEHFEFETIQRVGILKENFVFPANFDPIQHL